MSDIKLNGFVNGWSGRLGNAVARQYDDRVVIASRPTKKKRTRAKTILKQRADFRAAANYARVAITDPIKNAYYAALAAGKKFNSAYTEAIKDYMNPPLISQVDTYSYTGKAGDTIAILVPDELKISTMQVIIHLADSTLVESGAATYQPGTLTWTYTTQKDAVPLAGVKITVVGKDRPGRAVVVEVVM